MEGFRFNTPLQLRYSDFDMLGHLNSAQYVTLIELARIAYFHQVKWNLKEVSNVVASFKIDYIQEVVPTNEVEIWVRATQLGNKSFKLEYVMASTNGSIVYAKAESVQVCILKGANTSTPIPEDIRSAINSYENLSH